MRRSKQYKKKVPPPRNKGGRPAGKNYPVLPVDRVRIRQRRLELEIQQTELAERVGVTRQTIHRIESGDANASEALLRIYRTLDLDVSLMNRYDPDQERVLDALDELRKNHPALAGRFIEAIEAEARNSKALRERRKALEALEQEMLERSFPHRPGNAKK